VPIQTVRGPIDADQLGVTLPHEHLVLDASCLWTDPTGPTWVGPILAGGPGGPSLDALAHGPVVMQHLGDLLRAPHLSLDNLRLTDVDVLTQEVARFHASGGSTIVDLTPPDIGRDPLRLRDISRMTGVHVVMGCGHYVAAAHPSDLLERSEAQIADAIVRDLTEGVADTGIRAGIIGEIGTGNPMQPAEARVVRAAARAQRETGVALNIHISLHSGLAALDLALAEGVDPSRVVVSHADTFSNPPYQLAIAERGAYVEFDNFGALWFFGNRPACDDGRRVVDMLALIERGYLEQILISHDVSTKIQLTRFGGFGYAYLSRYIEPVLRDRGLSEAELHTLRVANPRRMLEPRPR
jgi:phosphotriesterase-related protein